MKLIICDDQALVREGLEMLLNLESDIEVLATAENGLQAVELAAKLNPDIILMDLKMPVMNGIEATRQIKSARPDTKVLILTTYDHDDWLFDALRVGASGYLLKDAKREEIISAIRGILEGKTFLDPNVAGRVVSQATHGRQYPFASLKEKLTKREFDVLRALAKGLPNVEIAALLHLSEGTVRNHISAILNKLQVTDRTQAAVLAIKHGLGG